MREYHNPWVAIPKDKQSWRSKLKDKEHLFIEIGAGAGLHMIQFAKQQPNDLLIPVERTKVKYQSLQRRYNGHQQPQNLYPVNDDAVKWISENITDNEVSGYYILYPNPYPKENQSNKRFHFMPFMSYLLRTLKEKGTITLATNEYFYYKEFKDMLLKHYQLEVLEDTLLEQNVKARTHFEKKYLERGETCYNLIMQKLK